MKSGDKVLLQIPDPILKPYSHWAKDWVAWLEKVRGTVVTLQDPHNIDSSNPGWKVSDEGASNYVGIRWVPTCWIKLLTQPQGGFTVVGGSYCVPCGGVGSHRLMCPTTRK